jgi:hypothetical protein
MLAATLFEVKSHLRHGDPVILPGESAELEVKNVDDATYAGLYVVFTDASGLEWKYRVGTQQFSKAERKAVWTVRVNLDIKFFCRSSTDSRLMPQRR